MSGYADLPGGYENKCNLPRKLTCLHFMQENKGARGLRKRLGTRFNLHSQKI